MTVSTTYTDQQRVEALTRLELNGGNMLKTSREMSIPRATLMDWRDRSAVLAVPRTLLVDRGPEIAERVAQEIDYVAFGNLSDVVQWDAGGHLTLSASADLTPAQAALISSIKVKRRREEGAKGESAWQIEDVEIRTRDKLKALEVRARMLGLLVDRSTSVEVNTTTQVLVLDGGG